MAPRAQVSPTSSRGSTTPVARPPRIDGEAKGKTSFILDRHFSRTLDERIRERAYDLYLLRGCREGCAEQDWLDAELEVLADR